MGATHFVMKTLRRVAAEMALHVLAYNLTRVVNIMGIQPLMAAIKASRPRRRPAAILWGPQAHFFRSVLTHGVLPDRATLRLRESALQVSTRSTSWDLP